MCALVALGSTLFFSLGGCVRLSERNIRRFASVVEIGKPSKVSVDKRPGNPILEKIEFAFAGSPEMSERSERVLRLHALHKTYQRDPKQALRMLEQHIQRDPSPEKVYAFSELAQIRGDIEKFRSKRQSAKHWYMTSLTSAYRYLFDPWFAEQRNHYDPEFRGACDLYNGSLEKFLRILDRENQLAPGHVERFTLGSEKFELAIAMQGPWAAEDIESFEFVADYEVTGLENEYQTFGLGVPLIAVQKRRTDTATNDESLVPATPNFYPRDLAVPITAFLRIVLVSDPNDPQQMVNRTTLELYDPLQQTDIAIDQTRVPLESDISMPLAYFLDDPVVSTNLFATMALLNADFASEFGGLYMLEPYDPDRIPVVMVHGLWSSPSTWMEMFNDLRGMPEIRKNYQFWFYMYPTGQPFWVSAEQMRGDLERFGLLMDPDGTNPAMQKKVLVGHSMGGLVSRMQTIESGNDFWKIVSDTPFEDIEADAQTRARLERMLFFNPNPTVSRVITIATPHRGSNMANAATRTLGKTLFQLPSQYLEATEKLVEENPDRITNTDLLTISTSLDSLSPTSPILPAMLNSEPAPWVRYHNIAGDLSPASVVDRISSKFAGQGDGVVSLESAHFEQAVSEITVPADHVHVHQHPLSTLEVRRILLEHLREYRVSQSATPPDLHRQATAVDPIAPQNDYRR